MGILDKELDHLLSVADHLDELLSTKTTKLPPAALEELRIAVYEVVVRFSIPVSNLLRKSGKNASVYLSFMRESPYNSVHQLLEAVPLIASILRGEISGRKLRPRQLNILRGALRDAANQLEQYLSQLHARRLRRNYLWPAENAVAPYSVHSVMPLEEYGFLILADSPGLSFEAAAPSTGLGESPADIAVDAYLDTDDEQVIGEVIGRVENLVEAMGYKGIGDVTIERGSIFRKSRATADKVADELKNRLIKVERAFELAQLELRQADVDAREAEAVNTLLSALVNVSRACLRVGSVLIIKYPEVMTQEPVVIVRNLSQLELRALDQFPEIQRSPERVLQALTMTLETMSRPENRLTEGNSDY